MSESYFVPKYANRYSNSRFFHAYTVHRTYRARNITQRNISDIPITTRSTPAQGCRRERIDGANSYTLSLESRSALRLRDIQGVHYLPRRGHISIIQGDIKAIDKSGNNGFNN